MAMVNDAPAPWEVTFAFLCGACFSVPLSASADSPMHGELKFAAAR
jgi:hypothetical protein